MTTRLQQSIITHLGKDLSACLDDSTVTDINVNQDGGVWVSKTSSPKPIRFDDLSSEATLSIIRLVARFHNAVVNEDNPTVGGEFPFGDLRFEGVIPPASDPGPSFSLRKHPTKVYPLEEYLTNQIITLDQFNILKKNIIDRKTVVLAGSTGSGKTTFINAFVDMIYRLCPEDRFVICEDVREIQCTNPNTLRLMSSKNSGLDLCIKTSLRHNPDRIIIGEIRDHDQMKYSIQGWNSGHEGGITSLHANSAKDAIFRMEDLCSIAFGYKSQRMIARNVGLLGFIKKVSNQRKLTELIELHGFEDGKYLIKDPVTEQTQLL